MLLGLDHVASVIVRESPHGVKAVELHVSDCVADTTGDRMAAHPKSDQRRDDLCADGLRQTCVECTQFYVPNLSTPAGPGPSVRTLAQRPGPGRAVFGLTSGCFC